MFIPPPESPLAIARSVEVVTLSDTERMAVRVGIMDGEVVLARSRRWGFFTLFVRERPRALANVKLEALRTYAELARILAPNPVPFTSLVQAGISRLQIVELMQMITRACSTQIIAASATLSPGAPL